MKRKYRIQDRYSLGAFTGFPEKDFHVQVRHWGRWMTLGDGAHDEYVMAKEHLDRLEAEEEARHAGILEARRQLMRRLSGAQQ